MGLIVPNPSVPTDGQPVEATTLAANLNAVYQAIQSFDASQVASGTLSAGAFAASINPNTILHDTLSSFVYSGCVWSSVSGLSGTMSSGVAYIANATGMFRVSVSSVGSNTFTASKDTYIDIDYNGNVYYQAVSNGASSPALTANSIRVAKIVTNGSAITSVVQQGYDSNSVSIYPQSPLRPAKYLDANGWTVYDNGKYKQYGNKFTITSVGAGASVEAVTNGNFPVGTNFSTLRFSQAINNDGSFVEKIIGNLQSSGTSTTFNFWVANSGTGGSGNITIYITAWDI